jgi:putative MATE family efflux protein
VAAKYQLKKELFLAYESLNTYFYRLWLKIFIAMSKLVESGVISTLFRMAFPMLAGTIAINSYNLVNTYFVSRLGTIPLAAMGFTFPVVMLITFISGGIATGVITVASHALGRKDYERTSAVITNGLVLMILVSISISIIGCIFADPLFKMLGANEEVLPFVKKYMFVWYFGTPLLAIPMMGNGVLLALGDSKKASLFMTFGAVLNCFLDPLLIFGLLGLPAMGITGAALATVLSQLSSTLLLIYLLDKKHKMLAFKKVNIKTFFMFFGVIIKFAIPASISMILMPLAAGIITALVSKHGNGAVAATSAASRVEMLAFLVPMALGMSLTPFVSQNFGAHRMDRINDAKRYSTFFSLFYGLFIALVFFAIAPLFAMLFTKDPEVARLFILYMRIIPFGYGTMELHRYCSFFFTGLHRPLFSTMNNFIRVLFLLIPLSLLGSYLGGIKGIFIARLIADISSGYIGSMWLTKVLQCKKIC